MTVDWHLAGWWFGGIFSPLRPVKCLRMCLEMHSSTCRQNYMLQHHTEPVLAKKKLNKKKCNQSLLLLVFSEPFSTYEYVLATSPVVVFLTVYLQP